MKCTLFFILLVLLLLLRLLPWGATQSTAPTPTEAASPLPETNGSTCAQWLYGKEPPQVEAFECAGQPDGAQVKFCCGTCGQTRNCSVEELAEGAPARPTDGAPKSCPSPPPPIDSHWERVTLFCGGVFANALFCWTVYFTYRRFWQRDTPTRETQEELEVETSFTVRSRESPGSSAAASTRLVPPSSAGAEGPPSAREGPAAASGNAPSAQPQAGGSGNVTIMWYPTGFVPLRIGPTSPSQPIRGGRRPRAGPRK